MKFAIAIKRASAWLLICVLLAAVPGSGMGESFPMIKFIVSASQLLKSPSAASGVLTAIRAHDAVYITGESGNYYIGDYEGYTGYVLKSHFAEEEVETLSSGYIRLVNGASGAEVRALQQALEELSYDTGGVDGKFGLGTQSAVAAFQKKNGLDVTGSADIDMQTLLYEGRPLNARGVKTDVKTLPPIAGWKIRLGDTGDAVTKLQTTLSLRDYYTGQVDGVCGTGTVAAIKKFQRENGLTADGVAGAETQNALYAPAVAPTAAPVATATPVAATYPYATTTASAVNLRKKASTSSARILTVPEGASIIVVATSGEFVQATYKNYSGYLHARYVNIPAQYLDGSEREASQEGYESLAFGSSGELVTALQQALLELEFEPGVADGKFGARTLSAVKAAQRINGYAQTGTASAAFLQLLFEGTPKNAKGRKTDISVLPPVGAVAVLRPGDKGEPVSAMQEKLIAIGHASVGVTGVYDNVTTAAISLFQAQNGLVADGVAGEDTLRALNAAMPAQTPIIALVTPTPTPITADNVIIMQSGTRGLAVTRLQERLVELGYYDITPDGIYDSNDIAAVRAFQSKNALKADGIAGLEVQLALYSAYAVPAVATPAPATPKVTATPTPDVHTLLKVGSSGDLVAAMQSRLITLNYLQDEADGIFGTNTARAVTAFQEMNGLKADGLAGEKSLTLLYSAKAKANTAIGMTDEPVVETLRTGSVGDAVRAMQARLITLGYLSSGADGIFGPATFLAVKAFQEKNSLTANGTASPATINLLNSANAKPAVTGIVVTPTVPTADTFTAPNASEVRFANWFTETRSLARSMPYAVVYDYNTGKHWNVHMFSFGKHADAEPVTKEDTAVMNESFGPASWTPHPVWIILSNGRVYMATTHNYPHEVEHNKNNNFNGHLCIHFPREMSEAQATGPYAVSHQVALLKGWDATQAMIH